MAGLIPVRCAVRREEPTLWQRRYPTDSPGPLMTNCVNAAMLKKTTTSCTAMAMASSTRQSCARNTVAAVLHPTDNDRAYYIFCGNRYAAIDIAPNSTNDTIAWGSKTIVDNWPSLAYARFSGGRGRRAPASVQVSRVGVCLLPGAVRVRAHRLGTRYVLLRQGSRCVSPKNIQSE